MIASIATATVDALFGASGLPRAEALTLLAHACSTTRERLIAGSRDVVEPRLASAFRALAARRLRGEPIAYLVGHREFYGRAFGVDARVLIPRPETELLVDRALRWIDDNDAVRVVDLGTGSGAIAITLALERPSIAVVATDRDESSLACARANATRLGARVRFVAGDWFDALDGDARFDLVVANPPYVCADDPHLGSGDLRFEPIAALTDGADGLAAIGRIVAGAAPRLANGGGLIIEHGHRQAAAVRALLSAAGFDDIGSRRDLAGIERISFGRVAA